MFCGAALLLCAIVSAFATEDDDKPTYRLKGAVHTGSMMPDTAAYGSLPYDKRYAELTPEQKEIVRSHYEDMAPGDEPPFPLDGLAPLMLAVSKAANMLGSHGLLDLSVEVDSQGTARSVSIYQAVDEQTTHVIAKLLMVQKYKQAVCSGKPCKMDYPLRVQFMSSP
jgi:hypothetical protein